MTNVKGSKGGERHSTTPEIIQHCLSCLPKKFQVSDDPQDPLGRFLNCGSSLQTNDYAHG